MSGNSTLVNAVAEPILELKNVVAGYGGTYILQDVSLVVPVGQRLAIIGRNGVGKTTTLATIMGQTQLHSGEILICGQRVEVLPSYLRSRMGLGLVPQTRDIFPSLNVEENLIVGQRKGKTIEEVYALFPRLKERRSNAGNKLSGGEQQMLSIARTLMGGPRVLMLDEPLEGLAPVICDMLMDTFQKLARSGDTTIILVEQHTELALEFAERVVVLEQGRIVIDKPASELRGRRDLIDRYVGLSLTEV